MLWIPGEIRYLFGKGVDIYWNWYPGWSILYEDKVSCKVIFQFKFVTAKHMLLSYLHIM